MIFLYCADLHGKLKNPISRLDIYAESWLNKIKEIQQSILLSKDDSLDGNEYAKSLIANYYISKKFVFTFGVSIIEDIIRLKLNVVKEKCADYRKIIIHTYESLTAVNVVEETAYNPSEDYLIEMVHPQCNIDKNLI